jgi:hypothetical protein
VALSAPIAGGRGGGVEGGLRCQGGRQHRGPGFWFRGDIRSLQSVDGPCSAHARDLNWQLASGLIPGEVIGHGHGHLGPGGARDHLRDQAARKRK